MLLYDLTGQSFGRLTVIAKTEHKNKSDRDTIWECLCVCGIKTQVKGKHLRYGHTKSCGCLRKDYSKTHGLTGTRTAARVYEARRRELHNNLDSLWTPKMEKLLCLLQPACVVCGKSSDLTTDHVKSLSSGYGLIPGNAVRLCRGCNSKKWAHPLHRLPKYMQECIESAAADFIYFYLSVGG